MKLTKEQIKQIEKLFNMKYTEIGPDVWVFLSHIDGEFKSYYSLSILDYGAMYHLVNRYHEKFAVPISYDRMSKLLKILEVNNEN